MPKNMDFFVKKLLKTNQKLVFNNFNSPNKNNNIYNKYLIFCKRRL